MLKRWRRRRMTPQGRGQAHIDDHVEPFLPILNPTLGNGIWDSVAHHHSQRIV